MQSLRACREGTGTKTPVLTRPRLTLTLRHGVKIQQNIKIRLPAQGDCAWFRQLTKNLS